ncbi:GNAT family N-acetyltransferase [Devosia sp. Root413D1]|uniref:GNAT family N-acetyltransferase n=1 Tax=unclassified Devosia TaxID=196773 RepID=UPI000A57C729|nr:GNAT family N-acetyltransferase [Devosia sp. Root413D1]
MEIRTARLLLRRPRADDLDAFFAIMSDARGMRYWSTLPHADREVTRAWLDQKIERTAAGGEDFAIEFEGRLVGDVGAGRLPDFGFMIHPGYWGRGIASEAAAAFIDYAFSRQLTDQLLADVDPRNLASLRVLEKLGFARTGEAKNTFLLGDEWCDSIYLALPGPR